MSAEYNPTIARALIESAQSQCDLSELTASEMLRLAENAGMFWMAQADKYQRRSRILTAVACALGGIAVALAVLR